VQLASAVATLAGSGGEGVIGSLRQKTGLDNLDVQSDAAGNTSVTAGKYLSDKTYSEVTVGGSGKSSISLNYDVTRHVTLKGSVDSDSNTSVGVLIQRDY
jgi:translocation and assembly module TamB